MLYAPGSFLTGEVVAVAKPYEVCRQLQEYANRDDEELSNHLACLFLLRIEPFGSRSSSSVRGQGASDRCHPCNAYTQRPTSLAETLCTTLFHVVEVLPKISPRKLGMQTGL